MRRAGRARMPDGAEPADAGIVGTEEGAGFIDEPEAGGDDGGGGVELEAAEAGLDALGFVEVVGVEDADVIGIRRRGRWRG